MVNPLAVAFGAAVARRRRAKRLSWRELGTRCRVSANTVRNVERGVGSSRLDIVARVAHGLGTPLWRLIREAEENRL
jgi:transcriptional regulator with XRE-family HTH domain